MFDEMAGRSSPLHSIASMGVNGRCLNLKLVGARETAGAGRSFPQAAKLTFRAAMLFVLGMTTHEASFDKPALKSALGKIFALIYLSTTRDLKFDQIQELQNALKVAGRWPAGDAMKGRAGWLCDLVNACGVLPSSPPQKLHDTEEIMDLSQTLTRYLDSN